MNRSKSMLSILFLLVFYTTGFSQALFIDSGQRLGNAASWNVKLGDLDGDGDLDAVTANNFWNNVIPQHNEIWLNNGKAVFSKSEQQLDPSNNVALYDIDNDGDLDIVEYGDWQTAVIKTWLNDGHAHFSPTSKYSFRGNLIIFNENFSGKDGRKVVTVETGSNTIFRIYSISNDTVVVKNTYTLNNFRATAMAVGDINGDGYSDIVVGKIGPTYILLNDKHGSFTISDQKLGNYVCCNLYLEDLNGDGFPDLLQCNYHTMEDPPKVQPAQLYLNDGMGKFNTANLPYNTNYLTQSAVIKDLNNDGHPDIYMNHGHRYQDWDRPSEILFNDGHANFTTTTVNLDLIQSDAIEFGDLDGDGDQDAFLAVTKIIDDNHYGGASRVWLNTTITNPTGIKEKKKEIPNGYELNQNYPNPFNPSTVIGYKLPVNNNIKLKIYDVPGREIKTIVDSFQSAREHSITWGGTDKSSNAASSGIYLCKMESNGMSFQKKMVLVR
jgi:hypothetical protein